NVSGITICSNKHAIGFSNHKHSPITTDPIIGACSLGVSVSIVGCHQLFRVDQIQTVFVLVTPGENCSRRVRFLRGNEIQL
ncbi:hypothetical protein, partial [Brevibacterium aurantiacum]|uniref:hypothetical protein n=1 Tax=Brevibacterium aurantiacum TaxID=273384 RepID=UPI001C60E472